MSDYFVMHDASLQRYNTLRLDVTAETVVLPHDADGLVTAMRDYKDRKRVLIGNGSNIFFRKPYYGSDYVFIVTTLLNDIHIENNEIVCESGARMNRLAWFACEQSVGGYAFCEDIPGTVGGGLYMNAGQWRFTIGKDVRWLDVYDPHKDVVRRVIPDEGYFGYRYSRLTETDDVVLRCGLVIEPGNYLDILEEMLRYRRERYVKQPRNYPNAGSVFRRPSKDGQDLFVWKLFDEVKLRGYRVGDAQVSEKHPGFIVNLGHASTDDIAALVKECQDRVKQTFDVDLHLEWRVID